MAIAFPNHTHHLHRERESPSAGLFRYRTKGDDPLHRSNPDVQHLPTTERPPRDRKISYTIPPPYRRDSQQNERERESKFGIRRGSDGKGETNRLSPIISSPRQAYLAPGTPVSTALATTMESPVRPSASGSGNDRILPSPSYPRPPHLYAHTHQPPKMTRHESFGYGGHAAHPSSHSYGHSHSHSLEDAPQPTGSRPPAVRSAHSAYTPRAPYSPGSGSNGEREEGEATPAGRTREADRIDMDELTTKGRKRKRLAKACSACHKNKRRCDGFAPCSNCEFSSRPCLYLNAQGEPIPPPRTRDASGAPNGIPLPSTTGSKAMSLSGSGQGQDVRMDERDRRADDVARGPPHQTSARYADDAHGHGQALSKEDRYSPAKASVAAIKVEVPDRRQELLDLVDTDLALGTELVDIFFRTCAPFNAMFHPATFHHRLYLGRTSPILLDAMYAYSARTSPSPALLACYTPDHPPWLRGEVFAERAHAQAERIIAARERGDQFRAEKDEWAETEEIQAFALLSIYFACLRQPTLALFYLDLAIAMLRSTPLSSPSPAQNQDDSARRARATLVEARNRTFWLVALHDLCAAANGRPRRLLNSDMDGVPLPGGEAWWVRFGGGCSRPSQAASDERRRDGLVNGTGDWAGEEGQVGEIGHVLRILSIFSDIMTVANGGGAGSNAIRAAPLHQHQEALKMWAMNLPPHLRFDEHNLALAIARLQSPLHHVALGGWAFGYMHAVAECGMFYLQAAVAQQPGSSWTAQRQSQAVENIAVVLDALGEKGREGTLMLFPIAVVSNWQDHIRSSSITPPAQSTLLEDRLNLWWGEAKAQWGVERVQVLERGFYPGAQGPVVDGPAVRQMNGYADSARRERLMSDSRYTTYARERHSEGALGEYGMASYRRQWSDEGIKQDSDRRYSEQLPLPRRNRERDVILPDPSVISGGGQYNLKHLLDATPIPLPGSTDGGDNRLGLYSAPASPTNPPAELSKPKHSSTIDSYLYPSSRPSQSASFDTVSSTSTSLLLPTPFSNRPVLPPLPAGGNFGNRPRATSSTVPYSTPRSPSPNPDIYPASAKEPRQAFTAHRYLPSLSSRTKADDVRLPPLTALNMDGKGDRDRRLEEIPRMTLGKDWPRSDPFSPTHRASLGNSGTISRGWVTEETSKHRDSSSVQRYPAAHDALHGIAALVSAAESEREREEQERSASGSGTGRVDAEDGISGGDVDMSDQHSAAVIA